jgi:hypothetical protein
MQKKSEGPLEIQMNYLLRHFIFTCTTYKAEKHKRLTQNSNLLEILFYRWTILGFKQEGSWLLAVQQQGL